MFNIITRDVFVLFQFLIGTIKTPVEWVWSEDPE